MIKYDPVLLCLFVGCGFQQELIAGREKLDLLDVGELVLPLDTMSSDVISTIQRVESNGNTLLYINDRVCKCINVYDLLKRKLVKKILLKKEGPNGVPGSRVGMFVHSPDSIFIHSTTIPKIFLINSNAELLRTYDLIERTDTNVKGYNSFPSASTYAPMHVINGVLYLNTRNIDIQKDNTEIFMCMMVNLKSGEVQYQWLRPSYYNNGNWGFISFMAAHTFIFLTKTSLL